MTKPTKEELKLNRSLKAMGIENDQMLAVIRALDVLFRFDIITEERRLCYVREVLDEFKPKGDPEGKGGQIHLSLPFSTEDLENPIVKANQQYIYYNIMRRKNFWKDG